MFHCAHGRKKRRLGCARSRRIHRSIRARVRRFPARASPARHWLIARAYSLLCFFFLSSSFSRSFVRFRHEPVVRSSYVRREQKRCNTRTLCWDARRIERALCVFIWTRKGSGGGIDTWCLMWLHACEPTPALSCKLNTCRCCLRPSALFGSVFFFFFLFIVVFSFTFFFLLGRRGVRAPNSIDATAALMDLIVDLYIRQEANGPGGRSKVDNFGSQVNASVFKFLPSYSSRSSGFGRALSRGESGIPRDPMVKILWHYWGGSAKRQIERTQHESAMLSKFRSRLRQGSSWSWSSVGRRWISDGGQLLSAHLLWIGENRKWTFFSVKVLKFSSRFRRRRSAIKGTHNQLLHCTIYGENRKWRFFSRRIRILVTISTDRISAIEDTHHRLLYLQYCRENRKWTFFSWRTRILITIMSR